MEESPLSVFLKDLRETRTQNNVVKSEIIMDNARVPRTRRSCSSSPVRSLSLPVYRKFDKDEKRWKVEYSSGSSNCQRWNTAFEKLLSPCVSEGARSLTPILPKRRVSFENDQRFPNISKAIVYLEEKYGKTRSRNIDGDSPTIPKRRESIDELVVDESVPSSRSNSF